MALLPKVPKHWPKSLARACQVEASRQILRATEALQDDRAGVTVYFPRSISFTNLAAARSTSQITVPFVGFTYFTGYVSGLPPFMTSASAAALSSPATISITDAALLIVGRVNVTRHVLNFWTQFATTRFVRSFNAAVLGNSEAVCPSGPMPRRIKSKRGNSFASN